VLLKERNDEWRDGLRIVIDSQVPEGKGVSSSAALEVAVLRAFADLIGCELGGDELARLCQVAENSVVGAPCGIMDQMTAALGRENQLLALRCQPATVEGYIPIPHRVGFWGIDSGIRHSVSGSDYRSVRCGSFMGYRMIADAAGLRARPSLDLHGVVELNDPAWNGYLANISPAEFQARFAETLPERILGAEFLRRYGGLTDRVTRVDPDRTYSVRQPTRHPIEENDRIRRFGELLRCQLTESSFQDMGRLMFESHASYSACGLGSEGTDLLVDLVREAGPSRGLHGARITGGGSGGVVAVLGRADAATTVVSIAQEYAQLRGRKPHVFRGSSPGVCCISHQLF
jgi:L-arabinokinase